MKRGVGQCFGPLVVAGVLVENDAELIQNRCVRLKATHPKQTRSTRKTDKSSRCTNTKSLSLPASDIDDLRKAMTLNELEVFCV